MRRRIFLAGTAASALAGCSAPANDYRLQAEPGPVLSQPALAVAVRSVDIPGYLDQNGIGRPSGDYRYATYPNDIWAEPLADMLQAVMAQELAQRLPAATIIASGGAIGAPTDAVVEMNVQRFDPDPDGRIDLTVQISVRRGGAARHWQTVLFTAQAAPAGPDAVMIVATMSRLWGQAADQVAAMLSAPGDAPA